ncbi:MAG: hypothetical protein AAFQ37_02340 [Bacteroidota bacterium]
MPWNGKKCKWGTPDFSNDAAATAVANADYDHPAYVNISADKKVTKKIFAYYEVDGYRICVVADVHRKNTASPWNIAGHAYIPGWNDWQMETPSTIVDKYGALPESGAFPGDNRYPHPTVK